MDPAELRFRADQLAQVFTDRGVTYDFAGEELVASRPDQRCPVRERHIVVARGRDYADVPPLKGIHYGAPASASSVTVDVMRRLNICSYITLLQA
jgi:hypothetical protein